MSFRHRIHILDKETTKKLNKCSSYEEYLKIYTAYAVSKGTEPETDEYNPVLYDGREYPDAPIYHIGTELFDFGSRYDNATKIQEKSVPLFENQKLADVFEDYEPFIISKEGLKCAIEFYRDEIVKELKDALDKEPKFEWEMKTPEERCKYYVSNVLREWSRHEIFEDNEHNVYNLGEGDNLTSSCYYEFAIWELVRIYKTFDWENNNMIFLGW